jgi:hypothetical protein
VGNLDCNTVSGNGGTFGKIDQADLDILLRCWGTQCDTVAKRTARAPGAKRDPNIINAGASAGKVDQSDLDKLLRCWGTTCR